jgi:pimeloyl-ACP methyl ester carboxylesterase
MHGVGGNHHLFDPQLAEFRSGRKVLAFDQRGCGGSADAPGGDYDLETRVRDLSIILDVVRIDPVILVGHGTGVQVVARYAERNPARVLGLLLVNPVAGNAEAGHIADLPEAQIRPAVDAWLRDAPRDRAARDAGEGAGLGADRPHPGDAGHAGRRRSAGPVGEPGSLPWPGAHPRRSRRARAWTASPGVEVRRLSAAVTGRRSMPPPRSTSSSARFLKSVDTAAGGRNRSG